MDIEIKEFEKVNIAVLKSHVKVINSVQDALDLLGNSDYLGARKIIIEEEHLSPDFFNLKTGLAGEILQKFSNYRIQLAIVGDFSKFESKALKDFIYESNKTGRVLFLNTIDEAYQRLI